MDDRAVTPMLGGLILMGLTIVMAGIVLAAWSRIDPMEDPPKLGVQESQGGLVIVKVGNGPLDWSDVTVTGCSSVPTGPMSAGDALEGCSGRVTLVYENHLLVDRRVAP